MEPTVMRARLFLCIAIVLLWSTTLHAQDAVSGVWSTTVENDKWGRGSDSNYTHGTRITYRTEKSARWLTGIAARLGCRKRADTNRDIPAVATCLNCRTSMFTSTPFATA